jgi:hypothetical protein
MHNIIALRGQGPVFPKWQQAHTNFWDTLMQQGRSWMWIHVSDKGTDTKWLAKALDAGTAIILSNGSYSQKKGPHICDAGWAVTCSKARRVVKGSFYKFSQELLGLVDAYTLVLHTARHYHLTAVKGKIICGSQSALQKGSTSQRQVRPGVKQADLFWTL